MTTSQTGWPGEIRLAGFEGPAYKNLCEKFDADPGGVGALFKV